MAQRPGAAEADQRAGHRGAGGRGGDQAELQPTPALHAGEGPQRRDAPGLLLRAGAHRSGPPDGIRTQQFYYGLNLLPVEPVGLTGFSL